MRKISKIVIPVASVGLVIATLVTLLPEDKPKIIEIKEPTEDKQPAEEKDITEEKTSYELHKEIEDIEKPTEETITKTFSHGNVTFTYEVGIENGVEETPSPEDLRAMSDSYSEIEKQVQKQIIEEAVRNGPQGTGKVIGLKNPDGSDIHIDVNKAYKETQIHINNKLKKAYIDSNFTCDNYDQLAKKFVGESMYGVGYAGSVENYIYTKALNECIQPKHQEEIDKVTAELEEVN